MGNQEVLGADVDSNDSSYDGMKTRQSLKKDARKKQSTDKNEVLARTRQGTGNNVPKSGEETKPPGVTDEEFKGV